MARRKASKSQRSDRRPKSARGQGSASVQPSTPVPSRGLSPPGARLWIFRVLAVVGIPLLLFGGMELALRGAGFGYPTAFLVPSEHKPGHLTDNYKFAWRFFPRALARTSQPLIVVPEKPPQRKRIVVLGESAAMGDPEPAFGFPRVLQALLEIRFPQQEFEIINAAVTAVNSHVIFQIAQDCRLLDASAWIIYMGNNEVHGPFGPGTVFGGQHLPLGIIRSSLALQRTRIGQFLAIGRASSDASIPASWGGLEMFLGHQVRANSAAVQGVYDRWRSNLTDILDLAKDDRTPVVISTVATNLRDCAPFASLHRESLTVAELSAWQQAFDQGCAAAANAQWDIAASAFEHARAIDADFAELSYRLAHCLLQQDKADRAHELFQQARDLDTLRFRCDSELNRIIAAAAAERGGDDVRLINAAEELAAESPYGIVGGELFWEHVHFNFHGNYVLALRFANELAAVLHLKQGETTPVDWPSEQQCAQRLGWTPFHQQRLVREMLARLSEPPFTQQLDHRARLDRLHSELRRLNDTTTDTAIREWIDQYRELLTASPNDWLLRQQFSYLLESIDDQHGAIEQWQSITELLPHHAEGHCQLGVVWNRAKDYDRAEQALTRALALRPDYARALNSLGICVSHQGRIEESYRHFARAIEVNPSYAEAQLNWGLVLAHQGDRAAAIERFRAAVTADPDYLPAHVRLGEYYVRAKQLDLARPHYEAVVRLKPNDPAARINLGLLYLKQHEPSKAIPQLRRAVALSPTNAIANQALEQARRLAGDAP
jgi:tetratricopeptide (TPR) repeat protein